jgi:hypothetical protein
MHTKRLQITVRIPTQKHWNEQEIELLKSFSFFFSINLA